MRKERKNLQLSALELNAGQLGWMPRNPREWTKDDVARTARSIEEDPDFLEERPLLVVPSDVDGKFVVFGGNLRSEGARKNRMKAVPCVIYYPETDADQEVVIRRAMKDNGSFGQFDWDILANEWDDLPLTDWGVHAWDNTADLNLTTNGMEGDEEYDEFVNKFKKKLTTDDCYTPPEVYDAVLSWIDEKIKLIKRAKVVRPFYPGGNYETFDYPKGCVVIDNPPFSIFTKIVRFYVERKIKFFLFGPSLTLFTSVDIGVTYIVANVPVTYENGAVVSTGFVTNLIETDEIIWVDGSLRDTVVRLQKKSNEQEKYKWPDNVISSALLGKLCTNKDCALRIKASEAEKISDLDWCKENKKGLYGGGFILSDAAAERAAAERAAAERAAAEVILSEREKAIIERLNEQDK